MFIQIVSFTLERKFYLFTKSSTIIQWLNGKTVSQSNTVVALNEWEDAFQLGF
jgi:hypothetical protein